MIKNFKNFILEARIDYFSKFEEVLVIMSSPIAKFLVDLKYKNVDVNFNYFDLTDKDGMISFFQDDKVGDGKILFEVCELPLYYMDTSQLRIRFGIDGVKSSYPEQGTVGWIKDIIKNPSVSELRSLGIYFNLSTDILHFVDLDGGNYIIESGLIKPLDSIKSSVKKQESRVGRLVKKVVSAAGGDFSDNQYEHFVTEFKSKVELSKNRFRNFEIVSGDSIKEFYYEGAYDTNKKSTLQNSCMRYIKCQSYFGIYVKNPKVCQLLILRSDLDRSKISARALIWNLTDGKKMIDRVYYSREQELILYQEWAKENGYYYQDKSGNFYSPDGKKDKNLDPEVELEKYKFEEYPYMDTLKYLNPNTGLLCENVPYPEEYLYLFLEGQDGGAYPAGD